ncbi:DNA polymerase delta subunit 3 [Anoplophora glabripennis]|uniref:DNA polymerase delta subunit 3 n=1 Tax=Anoplophora glabripennis TaxID=217634 RepID=UPI000873B42A|nr:DNA polymerase delta subunit 3 [Anoplophora glabripennis]
MDSATQEIYFQKIQELIQDDDKIVTVSSLAADLGVSIHNSRNLISKYVEDQRKLKPDELAVTYVVSGTLKENARKGVFMVKEVDLKEKKNIFEANLCEVIYSVQKNKNVDFNIIALVDMFNSTKIRETALHGSIVSKNCTKRTLKFRKLPSPAPPILKGKSSFFVPKVEASASSEKSTVSPKTEQKSKASGAIADLFKAAASKPKNGKGSVSKPNKPADKPRGLSGFLNNGALKSSKESNKKDKIKIESSSSNAEIQTSSKEEIWDVIDDSSEELVTIKEESKVSKKDHTVKNGERKNNSQEKPKKANKRRRDKSRELPSKKRKRIIERNSSDSDDMFEKDNDEDIIERSDEEPERIPSPVVQKPIVPKNKRRKAVTRNYEDEEGFIVTKTEYVYETASEDENVEPEPVKQEKKEEKPIIKSKAADKKKPVKNQATLMSFFTKK